MWLFFHHSYFHTSFERPHVIAVTSHGRHSVSNHKKIYYLFQQRVQTDDRENIKSLHYQLPVDPFTKGQ